MKKRWIALVLAAAVVGLPSWGVLALTGAGTAAAGETESMQDATRACVCAAEEASPFCAVCAAICAARSGSV